MTKLAYFKKQFYRDPHHPRLHLNNAGLSPISRPAFDKISSWGKRFYEEGFFTDHDYMQEVASAREALSQLIGCQANEMAFFQSTASAISQLCFQFPLEKDDEILMWDQEYGSNLYPWLMAAKKKEAKVVFVPSEDYETPAQKLILAMTNKTKVVAISWVQFQTGSHSDLQLIGEECSKRNIFFFVDIMQGLGLFPFHMKALKIDAVATGSHKWLVSPVGVGLLALDKKHFDKITPHNIGASTYGTCDDAANLYCSPKKDALKFEAGSKQVLEIIALGASTQLILDTSVEVILNEVERLASLLNEGLQSLGYKTYHTKGSIVNFIPKIDTEEKLTTLSCGLAKRGPGIRLSPHAHNREEDIERVLNALK